MIGFSPMVIDRIPCMSRMGPMDTATTTLPTVSQIACRASTYRDYQAAANRADDAFKFGEYMSIRRIVELGVFVVATRQTLTTLARLYPAMTMVSA